MMRRLAIVFCLLLLAPSSTLADDNPIVGTWKLRSFLREVIATGDRYNGFGGNPDGYIRYLPDGRMCVTLVREFNGLGSIPIRR